MTLLMTLGCIVLTLYIVGFLVSCVLSYKFFKEVTKD